MAVGLGPLSTLHPVPGFELGIASAGIKRPGRKDVVVMRCAEGSSVAGVFTLNAFCAAPVTLAKQRFLGEVRYLLTNTGNANAGTGEAGLAAAAQTCAKLAELAGVAETSVLPYSTGVSPCRWPRSRRRCLRPWPTWLRTAGPKLLRGS